MLIFRLQHAEGDRHTQSKHGLRKPKQKKGKKKKGKKGDGGILLV